LLPQIRTTVDEPIAERPPASRVLRGMIFTSLVAMAAAAAAQTVVSPARAIFERDWVLMNWALKFYDRDRNVLLSPAEAQAAANAFRAMADTNHDGRVTPQEYRAARAAILTRY
jgi:hypothetical protein